MQSKIKIIFNFRSSFDLSPLMRVISENNIQLFCIYSCCPVLSYPFRFVYYQYILAKKKALTHTYTYREAREAHIHVCHLLFLFSELVIFSLFSERNFYIFMMLKAFFPGRRHFKNSLPVTPKRPSGLFAPRLPMPAIGIQFISN